VKRVRSPTVREGNSLLPNFEIKNGPSLTVGLLTQKISIDEIAVYFYYRCNTGREVIKKYMSSNHSEVAET
jgi:hypothetical protein